MCLAVVLFPWCKEAHTFACPVRGASGERWRFLFPFFAERQRTSCVLVSEKLLQSKKKAKKANKLLHLFPHFDLLRAKRHAIPAIAAAEPKEQKE